MEVPRNRWTDGGWNDKLRQFLPLARWLLRGVKLDNPENPSADDLQRLYQAVSPKVFAEAIPYILEATGKNQKTLLRNMAQMWGQLGIGNPIPPRSLKEGRCDPSSLSGAVAIVVGGTVSWMRLRLDSTLRVQQAGAKFDKILMIGSNRICSSGADWRHPYIKGCFREGHEPTELEVLRQWVYGSGQVDSQFVFPHVPNPNGGATFTLEEQLRFLVNTKQWEKLVGGRKVFVATNGGNALYIPLHIRRVLGLDDIWFSQPASNLVHPVPEYWWPDDQDLMTTPSGIIRLWIELKANGCIE